MIGIRTAKSGVIATLMIYNRVNKNGAKLRGFRSGCVKMSCELDSVVSLVGGLITSSSICSLSVYVAKNVASLVAISGWVERVCLNALNFLAR